MKESFTSKAGKKLYDRLPAVYRERDQGDLANYLDAFGIILDQIHNNLNQQLADNFVAPNEEAKRINQSWLLPYFSDLLGADVLSTDETLQRKEVVNAVRWTHAKGTLRDLQEIAETLLEMGISIQEGWQRITTTPRIYSASFNTNASDAYFSTVTPKVNERMEAVLTSAQDPLQQKSGEVIWCYQNVTGVPNAPDSFSDVSRRTVDLRTYAAQQGYYHPAHLILYAPVDAGFCDAQRITIVWQDLVKLLSRSTDAISALTGTLYLEEKTNGDTTITLCFLKTENNQIEPLIRIEKNTTTCFFYDVSTMGIALVGDVRLNEAYQYSFDGFVVDGELEATSGWLTLNRCAVKRLSVMHADQRLNALQANSCLFEAVNIPSNSAVLEYCTILQITEILELYASDCIFATLKQGQWQTTIPSESAVGCIRYSCIPHLNQIGSLFVDDHNVVVEPVFYEEVFGKAGAGILSIENSAALLSGAEDSGELGAYHNRSFYQRLNYISRKLACYMPLNTKLLIKVDEHLLGFLQTNQPKIK